jgi:hypothetical protein
VWHFGTIGGDLRSVDRAVDKLLEQCRPLYFVYEAGLCGFVLYRHLTARGLACAVVAPAQVPSKPSDRIKTDRRDVQKLACTHRAGQLRPPFSRAAAVLSPRRLERLCWVPRPPTEHMFASRRVRMGWDTYIGKPDPSSLDRAPLVGSRTLV